MFEVGTVVNPLTFITGHVRPIYESVILKYPYRLNAMAIDPSKIHVNSEYIYEPGEVVFSLDMYRTIRVTARKDNRIVVSGNIDRVQLVSHAVGLMKYALNVKTGFAVEVVSDREYKHAGFGSSSSLIAGVAAAINELYGNPIPREVLVTYLAQNHGEEIEGDFDHLRHVQCIGGGAAAGLLSAGALILAGQSQCISKAYISNEYTVIIGIPKDYIPKDAQELMDLELSHMDNFIQTGTTYGPVIAYDMLHDVLPEMMHNKIEALGKLIYKYRFEYGSIKNCSFLYPPMVAIAERIKNIYLSGWADVLSLSSVGPAFFVITKYPEECRKVFESSDMSIISTCINNDGYKVLERKL